MVLTLKDAVEMQKLRIFSQIYYQIRKIGKYLLNDFFKY